MKYQKLHIYLIISIFILGVSCSKSKVIQDSGKEIVLRLEPSEENPRNSEGDFIQLKDGSILFVYTHFTGGSGDNAVAYLAGRFSDDEGVTWSDKDINIVANEGGMNIMSVSLLRLQNDEIALFYLRKNSETDCIPFMRISKDEGKTWSEPKRCIPDEGYHVVNNDRFVQLSGGRIIFATSRHEAPDWGKGKILSYYSDDNGDTWKNSQAIANPENIVLQEPGIIALKEDKLLLFTRTTAGVQYFSYSKDQGATWSTITPGNIKSPLSPASIERIPSTGDLLLLWNNNYEKVRDGGKRTPFNLAISKNDGETWDKIKTIESDPWGWYCYTAIEFVGDHVLLAHCAGDTKTNNGLSTIQITRLSLDWIYKEATSNPIVKSDNEQIILESQEENVLIKYTLDGSLPAINEGLTYTKPFTISNLTPLYMQAFQAGKTPSQIIFTQIGSNVFQESQKIDVELIQGLNYQYYTGEFHHTDEINLDKIIHTGITSQINIQNNAKDENFAFIFDGYIKVSKGDLYTFYLKSNDGSVMFLNDRLLINNDGAHGVYERSVSTSLKKGYHKIKVKYFQLGGGKDLEILWKSSDFEKEEISKSVLYHEVK